MFLLPLVPRPRKICTATTRMETKWIAATTLMFCPQYSPTTLPISHFSDSSVLYLKYLIIPGQKHETLNFLAATDSTQNIKSSMTATEILQVVLVGVNIKLHALNLVLRARYVQCAYLTFRRQKTSCDMTCHVSHFLVTDIRKGIFFWIELKKMVDLQREKGDLKCKYISYLRLKKVEIFKKKTKTWMINFLQAPFSACDNLAGCSYHK